LDNIRQTQLIYSLITLDWRHVSTLRGHHQAFIMSELFILELMIK